MRSILLVDDDSTVRAYATKLLEGIDDVAIQSVESGADALEALRACRFDLVVTDLVMPATDGLELISQVRERHPDLPVVLMTAQGSELVATQALRAGAVNYIAKRDLASELSAVCRSVLDLADSRAACASIPFDKVVSGSLQFETGSVRARASELGRQLQQMASVVAPCDGGARTQVGVALEEALLNAVIHGNLEISSRLRERGDGSFERLVEHRQTLKPYADRKVQVRFSWDETEVQFVIRDEGPGFDVNSLPDPTDPENLMKASGRGILLMHAFMDRVEFNEQGNEVRMTKYHAARPVESSRPCCEIDADLIVDELSETVVAAT